jgi:hypothetical protein
LVAFTFPRASVVFLGKAWDRGASAHMRTSAGRNEAPVSGRRARKLLLHARRRR